MRNRERGSVLVEFIFVFPMFLILCLFVIEVSLMWADQHVARLAAFEAARVLAGADLPYYESSGARIDSPCKSAPAMKAANQAAMRRMAIVTPPYKSYLAKMQTGILPQLVTNAPSLPTLPGSAGALSRLVERWPTAVIGTKVECSYDETIGIVRVDLTYDRIPQTPIVDRVMWMLYRLSKLNSTSATFDLDPMFLMVETSLQTPGAVTTAKTQIASALDTIRKLDMPVDQAADFLGDVPGAGHVFGALPTLDESIDTFLGANVRDAVSEVQRLVAAQSRILTAVHLAVPEAFRTIPIHTTVELARDFHNEGAYLGTNAQGKPALKDPEWSGTVPGSMNYQGPYRDWGHTLTRPGTHMKDGTTL